MPPSHRAQLEDLAVRQAAAVGAVVEHLLDPGHGPQREEREQRRAVVGLLGRPEDHAGSAAAAFSASRCSRPARMTSLKDLKRKIQTTEPSPMQNVSTAIAICWPTE